MEQTPRNSRDCTMGLSVGRCSWGVRGCHRGSRREKWRQGEVSNHTTVHNDTRHAVGRREGPGSAPGSSLLC